MKKIVALIMLFVLILCTGCASRKTAITTDEFETIVEEAGLDVDDTTELYSSPLVKKSLGAYNKSFTIELLIAPNDKDAQRIFTQTKEAAESNKSSASTTTSSASGNKAKFKLTSDGTYYLLSKIENTVIYVETDADNKKEVDKIVKELGY